MDSSQTACANCNEALVEGIFKYNRLLHPVRVALINEIKGMTATQYCNRCGNTLWKEIAPKVVEERDQLQQRIERLLKDIPVVTLQAPLGWDYQVLGMVSGQSTTGTGVISEFTSSFTDLFGKQAGAYNEKIRAGEDLCKAQLRKAALELGGSAIIGSDIDYSELGGGKGMIMVCMSGTAIRLRNQDILGKETAERLEQLSATYLRWSQLIAD